MRPIRSERFERFKHLGLIDVHNHDADYYRHTGSLDTWARYHIGQTVLFGSISEPKALQSDELAWLAYADHPSRIIPFFSGFPMDEASGLDLVREKLERGYYGIGETVAASTYSPLTSKLAWKARHPMDGNLPAIYTLCAEYQVPILLHIDPPFGEPIEKLEEALAAYPMTAFIFAHANVFNPPAELERLVSRHANLYIDFFAGFAAYDPANEYPLETYIPVIRRHYRQFLLSTDSATAQNLDYERAIHAMYEVIELCGDDWIRKAIARDNFVGLTERQPITARQRDEIATRAAERGMAVELAAMNKRTANEWLIRHGGLMQGERADAR